MNCQENRLAHLETVSVRAEGENEQYPETGSHQDMPQLALYEREHSVILTSHRGPLYNQQERATSPCEERSHLWEQLRLSRLRRSVQENSGTRSATNSMTALTSGSMDCRSSSQSPSRP